MNKLSCLLATLCLLGCAEIENDSALENDSLTVIPVGPGTRPDVIIPPDTPVSEKENRPER